MFLGELLFCVQRRMKVGSGNQENVTLSCALSRPASLLKSLVAFVRLVVSTRLHPTTLGAGPLRIVHASRSPPRRTLNVRFQFEHGSNLHETSAKRVSDDLQFLIY